MKLSKRKERSLWTHTITAAIRTAFGVVWALDAYFKWQPGFYDHYLSYITGVIQGQPKWLLPWFDLWRNLISLNPTVFSWATRIIEPIIAIGLLTGFSRKWLYLLGTGFALIIWSVPEGFGGPYTPGATDIGAGLIYSFVFIALILLDYLLGRSPYSVDFYIENVKPGWMKFAEWAPADVLKQDYTYLPWSVQIATIIGLLAMMTIFLVILGSELNSTGSTTGLIIEWFHLKVLALAWL
jgi:nitrite reductase (NO-forming)